jgi:predicted kinase
VGDRPTLLLMTGPPATGKSTLAEAAARTMGGPVLAWDWVMAGMTRFDGIQAALRDMDRVAHRSVGWSILWNLAVAQLRQGRSVVLDGAARDPEADGTRRTAADTGARCVVAVTSCRDVAVHRERVEGRLRGIPGWHELDWDHVSGFLARWDPPRGDVCLDAMDPLTDNIAALEAALRPA